MTEVLDPATGDIAAAVEAGRLTAEAEELNLGSYYAVATPHGVHEIDLTGDEHRDRPRRTRRRIVVQDVASFLAYWAKHVEIGSEVYADRDQRRVVGIIDAPAGPADTNWCQHIIALQMYHSDAWRAWTGRHREYLWQAAFAEHIEDHRHNIVDPPGAEMLEVAQTLQATTKVSFKSGFRLVDGQRQISYVEDSAGSAGAQGQLSIPATFKLQLPIWFGDEFAVEVSARLRYRIEDGRLKLGYALDQVEELVQEAFAGVVDQVSEGVGQVVMYGTHNT